MGRATPKAIDGYMSAFVREMHRQLAEASAPFLASRWLSMRSIAKLFRLVRLQLQASELRSRLSNEAIQARLVDLGFAKTLDVEGSRFVTFDPHFVPTAGADPLELLTAAEPEGTICYFSALAFHSLTTQPVRHHHVARSIARAPAEEWTATVAGVAPQSTQRAERQPLGQRLFAVAGVDCYLTERSARLFPGAQVRAYGPYSSIRIATYEQTLLDALFKPFHCGGPEVVFEAWREAVDSSRLDEERLADYLRRMNYPATARRTAVMLAILDRVPGRDLQNVFDAARSAVSAERAHAVISLLPGVPYERLDADWLVRTP